MKKIIFLFIVLSFLIAGCKVMAEETLPDPGILPDNNFYFLKSWKESIQTFFTFGAENKAKQFLRLAEVRLAEYQKMIEKGKTEIAEKTLEKYEQQLNRALEKAEEAKEKGKDVEKLKEAISEKIIKHQEALIEVLNKVPEEARKGIEKAIEVSRKGFEEAVQAVSGEKKEELERKAEEVRTDSSEPTPTEIRYFTCPDGTKVESGKCYGQGETLSCSLLSSPELKCSAPTPPVTKGGVCQTLGKTEYYTCSSGVQVQWCVCGPESGAAEAKNVWQCQHLPELYCPKPTTSPTEPSTYISCTKGGTKDHRCSDGTMVRWQCECFTYEQASVADYHYDCDLEPAKFCGISTVSAPLTITEITIRLRAGGKSLPIFWTINVPALSYIEYGPTTSYGFRAGGSTGGSLDTPGTEFVVEGQGLIVGTSADSKLRPDTLYHFRIIAEDTKGNKFVSQDYTFTTGL